MSTSLIITILIVFCIAMLVLLPKVFLKQNAREAAQTEFENYIKHLSTLNKQYIPHQNQLMSNLNVINFWLQTGEDPNDADTVEAERVAADRYRRKLMTPQEAKEFENLKNKTIFEKADLVTCNERVKKRRLPKFEVVGLEPCEVQQAEMEFYYSTEYGENIYYCVTPKALEKKYYRNVIYFTTARPSKIPMVYPNKYEGAQMLSLYKHPAQLVWFLTNWKTIRDNMETPEVEDVELEDTIKDFDV